MKKSGISLFSSIGLMALVMMGLFFIGWLIIPPMAAKSISEKADVSPLKQIIHESELSQEEAIQLVESISYSDFKKAYQSIQKSEQDIHEKKISFLSELFIQEDIILLASHELSDNAFNKLLDNIEEYHKLMPVLFPSFKNLIINEIEKYFENEKSS
jgi:hypothetical protein